MKSRAVDVVLVVALIAVVFIGWRVRATREGGWLVERMNVEQKGRSTGVIPRSVSVL